MTASEKRKMMHITQKLDSFSHNLESFMITILLHRKALSINRHTHPNSNYL